jgi:hypothetical protein
MLLIACGLYVGARRPYLSLSLRSGSQLLQECDVVPTIYLPHVLTIATEFELANDAHILST